MPILAHAHRARFAGDIKGAPFEFENPQLLASLAEGDDLGVGGGAVGNGDLIGGFGEDGVVLDDDSSERLRNNSRLQGIRKMDAS